MLEVVVNALYNGHVVLNGRDELKAFAQCLSSLQSLGILLNLRPCLLRTSDVRDAPNNVENLSLNDSAISTDNSENNDSAEMWPNFENTDDAIDMAKDVDKNFDEEFEWEVWSFCKPGPRRSKRVPIPKRFTSGEGIIDPVKPTADLPVLNPGNPPKEGAETEELKPLALNRSKRKTRQSDETCFDKNGEIVVDIIEEPKQKSPPAKRSKKEEEIIVEQAVKKSPR